MITIFKYEICRGDSNLSMPENSEILTVQIQNNEIRLWAKVNTEMPAVSRQFKAIPTGHEISTQLGYENKYISTVQLFKGDLVYHIFEVIKII